MSAFSATGRDTFRPPQDSEVLDPGLVTAAQQAVQAVQARALPAVRVQPKAALSHALCLPVQRWLWVHDGTFPAGGPPAQPNVLLSLSSAFIEDAGVTVPQGSNPTASLASSHALEGSPHLPVDLPGTGGASLPAPGWARRLSASPIIVFSARLLGATGDQAVVTGPFTFFDAGSGTSPRALLSLSFGHPDLQDVALPLGTYELCLLALSWG